MLDTAPSVDGMGKVSCKTLQLELFDVRCIRAEVAIVKFFFHDNSTVMRARVEFPTATRLLAGNREARRYYGIVYVRNCVALTLPKKNFRGQ